MISIAVFLIILAFILPLFVRFDEERQTRFVQEDLDMKSVFVTDYLLKTTGSPGWNYTNVTSLGLANRDGTVNTTKIRNFMHLTPQRAKELLGLTGVEFNLSFKNGDYRLMTGVARSPAAYFFVNKNLLFSKINKSGLVWDLYTTTAQQSDARFSYQGAKAAVFSQMLANASEYRTIIIEDPELAQSDIDLAALQSYVGSGGTLIYAGDASLISSGFSASSGTAATTGNVIDNSLIDAALGSIVVFQNPNWYFYGPDVGTIVNTTNGAYVGHWNHGVGEIYYVTDMNGTIAGKPLADSIDLIGRRVEFSTGQMMNMVPSSRPVVLDSRLNSLATTVMVIGK